MTCSPRIPVGHLDGLPWGTGSTAVTRGQCFGRGPYSFWVSAFCAAVYHRAHGLESSACLEVLEIPS